MKGLLRRIEGVLRSMQATRSERGPYRYVVRDWARLSDVNVAAAVIGTDFFREEVAPVELRLERIAKILVLAPHQDDETIGAGGVLLQAAARAAAIDLVYVTDGAIANPPYAASTEAGVQVRMAEARRVAERLGARVTELGVSNVAPRPTVADVDRLVELVWQLRPDVILSPWLLDWPQKHRVVNHLLWLAHLRRPLPEVEIWGYQVHNQLLANAYVDITNVIDAKRELLEMFVSQNATYDYTHMTLGMNAWNSRLVGGAGRRFIETFFTLPTREFAALAGHFYSRDLDHLYRGQTALAGAMRSLHAAIATERRI